LREDDEEVIFPMPPYYCCFL